MKKLALVLAVTAALAACSKPVDTASTPDTTTSSSSASTTTSPPADTSTASPGSMASPAPSSSTSADTTVAANSTSGSATPSSTSPDASGAAAMGASGPGPDTYQKACVVCHGAGVAGAPKLGDKADWGPRIAQGNDVLYEHAIKGYTGKKGMMPPKGGQTSLPDGDVKAAVDYMVAQGK